VKTPDDVLPLKVAHSGPATESRFRWFAVNTHPAAEAKANDNLMRQGWATFYPRTLKTIRHSRRIRTELRPFFPGYVFVALDPLRDAWRVVDSTYGVRHLVRQGDRPSPVPPGIVEGLQAMMGDDGRIVFTSALNAGDKVRFLAGPFADMIGSLERLDANGRVLVLLDLLGRPTHVQAKAVDLAPAS
jgi:transcription elongation factor/antiterminator RfaH